MDRVDEVSVEFHSGIACSCYTTKDHIVKVTMNGGGGGGGYTILMDARGTAVSDLIETLQAIQALPEVQRLQGLRKGR